MNKFNLMAMNKRQLITVLICVLIFGESIGLIYFATKSKDLFKKLEIIKPGYQKLSQDEQELKSKYTKLFKEDEALKVDRDNILAQTKSLMGERNRANELVLSLEKANLGISQLQKEKEEIQNYNLNLKEEIGKFQEGQIRLTQERDDFKVAYEKARKDTVIKELNNKISNLQKEKNRVEGNLKNKQKEIDKLTAQKSKVEAENEYLSAQLKDYKKNYAQAVIKNKKLEHEAVNIPNKFSEIARQNKRLIRETSEMHYNLGVFYTKNKEYERAVAEFEKVVEITPDDSYAHFNLGYIYAEYIVNRLKAIEHFRHFLRLAKSNDKDIDWVKKYLLTWETFEGKKPMQ